MVRFLLVGLVTLVVGCTVLACTVFSSTAHLKDIYGVRNVATGKGLRPYNAYWWTENRLVLYDYNNWKCMTWHFTEAGDNTYQLENLSTGKTFQARQGPEPGTGLWQQRLKKDSGQYWEFLKQSAGNYLIRQKGTELYLTAASDQTDSDILLLPNQHSAAQLWQLVEQHPRQ